MPLTSHKTSRAEFIQGGSPLEEVRLLLIDFLETALFSYMSIKKKKDNFLEYLRRLGKAQDGLEATFSDLLDLDNKGTVNASDLAQVLEKPETDCMSII